MKVAALVHFAFPYRLAGSETVLHELMKAAGAAGHEVRVFATDLPGKKSTVYEGVPVEVVRNLPVGLSKMKQWGPDVCVTHHQNALTAIRRSGGRYKTVLLVHNEMDLTDRQIARGPSAVIYNANWTREVLQERTGYVGPTLTILPPLDFYRHAIPLDTGPRDCVTQINLNADKGAEVFYALAERMPDIQFLAVAGGHGRQIIRHLPNVEHIAHTPDLAERVWPRTRVLLMPSIYESFGLVGVEAGCAGIPTVCHPTPGLVESQGAALIEADRGDLSAWEFKVSRLLHEDNHYLGAQVLALSNSQRVARAWEDSRADWLNLLEGLVNA